MGTFFCKRRKIIKWCCPCRVFHINLLHLLELAGKQELWGWQRGNLGSWLVSVQCQNEQCNFLRGKKGDIQNQSFLPSLSHLLLLVLALDVAKPCSNPFLASFRVSLGPEHHRQQQQQSGWQFFWGGSVWTRVCWGLRGFAPLPTGRMQASCRPCSHANSSPGALSAPICADICGSFISPLASVLQKWAPEHVFYEKLSLLTLFSNESCFFNKRFQPSSIQTLLL